MNDDFRDQIEDTIVDWAVAAWARKAFTETTEMEDTKESDVHR